MKRFAIATPTYNEARNIPKLVKAIGSAVRSIPDASFDLLVIDDNSPDGTASVVETLARRSPAKNLKVSVLKRAGKDGLGKAYIHGFSELLKQKYDYIIQMDADLSHNPKYLKDFVDATLTGHDFVVASRYLPGGDTPDWGWHRKLLSRGGNLYARCFLGNTITDYTGGYNMYRTDVLKKIHINTLRSGGYGFLLELKYRALQVAQSPYQIPIVFHDRQHGKSKIPKSTLFKNFILVPKIRFQKTTR